MSAKKRVDDSENFRSRSSFVQKEFEECAHFFQDIGLRGVFLLFGSARAKSSAQIAEARAELTEQLQGCTDEVKRAEIERQLQSWKRKEWMAPIFDLTSDLCRLLTQWSVSDEGRTVGQQVWSLLPGGYDEQPLMVCTGGGPGFMEAGNIGASKVPNSKSLGVGIELPFETKLNDYVSPNCGLTVHSFYARKYWEVYAIKAMIIAPGGFGTLDEMFEVMTLVQCKHCPRIPIVLLGREFWTQAINFRFLAEREVISRDDVDAMLITDDPQEAFEYVANALRNEAQRMQLAPSSPKATRITSGSPHHVAGPSGFTAGAAAASTSADEQPQQQQQPAPPPFRRERDPK